MGRVILKDIAEACGLSRSAVSLVVQDSPRVSEQTKARVRKVMAEMGYVYDRGAANLRTRRSMIVGLIVTNVRNPYFAELTMAIEQGLQDAGYTVLQGYSYDERGRQDRLISAMLEHRTAGVILLPAADSPAGSLQMLKSPQGTPTVLIARRLKGYDADYAGVDNVKAGELLGEHIRSLGARSVTFVGGPAKSTARDDRYRGLARALKPGAITLSPRSQHAAPSTAMDGECITHELLQSGNQPDVIPNTSVDLTALEAANFKAMISEVTAEFPFSVVATTLRSVITASINDWGAIAWSADSGFAEARHRPALEIYDRVGGGDSFASGLIYGLLTTSELQSAVEYGAAHGALAMTTPGDTSMASLAEVEALMAGAGVRVQR